MEATLKNNTSKQLLWIGMIGITMFFAGLTSAVIVRSADHGWEAIIMPQWFWYSTFAIVLSSITLMIAKKQVKKGISPTSFIVLSLVLGLLFSCFQIMGWGQLVSDGIFLTGEKSHPAGSFLYVITLAHLIHLVGGLISIIVTTVNAIKGKYNSENYLGIELTTIYWHFLDALWLYLFFFMKYIT